jgi:hypothetical protein
LIKEEAMLKYININKLSETEKKKLRQVLQEERRSLQATLEAVSLDLELLSETPKPKKAAKRRTG